MKQFLSLHRVALCASLCAGLISVLPQVVFVFSLGSDYRGLPLMQTPNEGAYLAIMREITDGHPLAASFPFFEYKEAYPLLPPTIAFLYAAVSIILQSSAATAVLLGKFFLPALLFFLAYLLIFRLSGEPASWQGRMFAVAGGALVTLGFDLVDYRTLSLILTGSASLDNFLIWTRPVNPIGGALLLFFFLWCLSGIASSSRRILVIPAAIALALMMASYVFSWTLALAIAGILFLCALSLREYAQAKYLVAALALGSFLALPYWYMVFRVSRLPDYAEAAGRIGLSYTHAPVLNKFLLAVFVLLLVSSFFYYYRKRRMGEEELGPLPQWWRFCLALLLGGFVAYNQQVITGIDIWHSHYVFYTIPLGFVVVMLVLWRLAYPYFPRISLGVAWLLLCASVALGVYTQTSVYAKHEGYYRAFQNYADVTDFLNANAPHDCVVLQNTQKGLWQNFIPAFSSCNLYVSNEIEVLAPNERLLHNYLALLRLRGISERALSPYLEENIGEAYEHLRFRIDRNTDSEFATLTKKMPELYRAFLLNDFRTELSRYRLDYILAVEPISPSVLHELGDPLPLLRADGADLYAF